MLRYRKHFGFSVATLILVLSALLSVAASARAADKWASPFKGVLCLDRVKKNPNWHIHAVIAVLKTPGLRVAVTPPAMRGMTVSAYAKKAHAQIAVNASFFLSGFVPIGLTMGEGHLWRSDLDSKLDSHFVAAHNRVEIVDPGVPFTRAAWMTDIASARTLVLKNGAYVKEQQAFMLERAPRTAVGLSRDKKILIVMVVDGRSSASVGMTAKEEAKALVELGAWTGLNLDGGGSTAMYIQGKGVVNHPSDGYERHTANQLVLYAPHL